MPTPESYEKAEIRTYLASIGAYYFNPYMAGYGHSGVPDIVGCYKSKFFGIEAKRPCCHPTVIQSRRMETIEKAGGKTFWGPADKVIREFEAWIG